MSTEISAKSARFFESRGLNGQEKLVQKIKDEAAGLLDAIDSISIPPDNREAGRLVALARTELEACVMWAIKAISRG